VSSGVSGVSGDRAEAAVVVNGDPYPLPGDPRVSLLDFVRERAGLTGTHAGCEQGACGACTVLLDGRAVRSCLVLAVSAAGRKVTTVEGVTPAAGMHPVQEALVRHHGLQCGYCTPGMVLTAIDLLDNTAGPLSETEVREAVSGNLCRCTGYSGIVAAIVELAAGKP
jgi:carbon-monoxide dehydrogenase small subunit